MVWYGMRADETIGIKGADPKPHHDGKYTLDVAEIYGNALFTPSFPMFNYVNIQKVLQSEHSR